MNISPSIPILIGAAAALGCLLAAFFNLRKKRIIDDTPTSKSQGVFIGLTELKGTAESEKPFTSFLAGIPCVEYHWQVEEHWQRTVTETYRDAQGHTQTRTKTESGWKTVATGGQSGPFYLKDDSGVIRIVPEGAKIHDNSIFNRTCSMGDPLYYGKGPATAIANSTHQRRFHEEGIPLHAMLYIMGQARQREDVVAPEIAADKGAAMFLISTQTERQISSGYGVGFWVLAVVGLLVAAGGGVGWAATASAGISFGGAPLLIMGLGYVAVLLVVYVWTTFNSLINLHHRVEQGWSQVEVELKRRHDLIPNLVQAVQGYKEHESETQTLLAALRGQMEATLPGVSGPDFQGLAPLLRITVERYPDLKANESFLKLQQALVDTEQRIALARDYFNDVATFFNTRLGIIPDRFVAGIARLKERRLLEATDFERAPVTVNLAA